MAGYGKYTFYHYFIILIKKYSYSVSVFKEKRNIKNISAMIITSKSNMIEKFTANGKSKGIVERYRIIIPTKQSLRDNTDLETYREFQKLTAIELKLDIYVDTQALNDIARFYYPSSLKSTHIIIKSKKVMDISSIELEAIENVKKEKEIKKIEISKKSYMQIDNKKYNISDKSHSNYFFYIDVELILSVSILTIIQQYETVIKEYQESSYQYIKTNLTKYSIIDNMIYDFKNNKTYNTLTYLEMQLQTNNLNTIATKLQDITGEDYSKINYEIVKIAIDNVLKTAINDKTFEDGIKKYFGCKYCRFMQDSIQIANKIINLTEIGVDKSMIIKKLMNNRNTLLAQ